MVQHIELEGTYNVRDLGGYPTSDGRVTKSGVLIRAGSLEKVSPAAQQQLMDYGVKTIIDLRDEWETEKYPNAFAHSTTVNYLNLPLIGNRFSMDKAWKRKSESYESLYELYGHYLDTCQEQVGAVVEAIAESVPTTIFHCYAGKDRTGIVAALVFDVVGVPDALIAEDYAHTTPRIRHLVAEWRASAKENKWDMRTFEEHVSSEARTMLSLLDLVRQRYGDTSQYLRLCGVSQGQLDRLKTQLVGAEAGSSSG